MLSIANTYDTRRRQLGERPGEYKHHDYVTGKEEIGALPEDVHEEISELLSELQETEDKDALVSAAYFHAKFENIHPFADGNGRTGRLAMNYFLVTHNHLPIIIHAEDCKEYYSSLEAWDLKQDLAPFCNFLKQQTEKTWEKQIRRSEERSEKSSSLAEQLKALKAEDMIIEIDDDISEDESHEMEL